METDYAIIGGGVVGLSVAWGMLKRGLKVTVLDGDDGSFRASRGNFGLVWVQSKGMNQPRYAQWSQQSAAIWAAFAEELGHNTGTTVPLEQKGGYDLHFSEETLQVTVDKYNVLKSKLNGDYPKNSMPRPQCPAQGRTQYRAKSRRCDPAPPGRPCEPAQALDGACRRCAPHGRRVLTGKTVTDVTKPDGFRVACADGTTVSAGKIVLSAGLGRDTAGPKTGVQSAHSSATRASPDHRKAAQADQPPVADRTAGGRRWDTDRRHKRGSGAQRPGHATRIVGPGRRSHRSLSGAGNGATCPVVGCAAYSVARWAADLSGKSGYARRISCHLPQRHNTCCRPCASFCPTGWKGQRPRPIWRCSVKPVLPFLELEDAPRVQVTFDGTSLDLPEGANLAASLLAAGVDVFRHTPVSGAPRGPFCMMGACFDCLVEIDGMMRQACMIEVTQGLQVITQRGLGADDDKA